MRDMTKAQFDAACRERGFTPGHMGYYNLPLDTGNDVLVNILNAGPRWRDRLAYLIQQQQKYNRRDAELLAATP